MPGLLLVRPRYDEDTRITFGWAHRILDVAVARGIPRADLGDGSAVRTQFHQQVIQLAPDLVFFVGHGNDRRLVGCDRQALVDADDPQLLKGTIVCAIACWSANQLGPAAIASGARAYIGFTSSFWLADSHLAPVANAYLEQATFHLGNVLLEGRSCNLAAAFAREEFNDGYVAFEDQRRREVPDAEQAAAVFLRNLNALRVLGNVYAKL